MKVETKSKITKSKKTANKARNKRADNLWAKYIKQKACRRCEKCGNTEKLHAHHIITKGVHITRWDVRNGVCLCVKHHFYWAHSRNYIEQREYQEWILRIYGFELLEELRALKYGNWHYVAGIELTSKEALTYRNIKIGKDIEFLEDWKETPEDQP